MTTDLKHYGVIGMKWGIRRYQPYPDGKTGRYLGARVKKQQPKHRVQKQKVVKTQKQQKQRPQENRKKTTKEMSDDELRKVINRLQMERQYAQLTAVQKSRGKKLVEEVLDRVVKDVASSYLSKQLKIALDLQEDPKKKKDK